MVVTSGEPVSFRQQVSCPNSSATTVGYLPSSSTNVQLALLRVLMSTGLLPLPFFFVCHCRVIGGYIPLWAVAVLGTNSRGPWRSFVLALATPSRPACVALLVLKVVVVVLGLLCTTAVVGGRGRGRGSLLLACTVRIVPLFSETPAHLIPLSIL